MSNPPGYDRTVEMTLELVERAKIFSDGPIVFRMLSWETPLLASLADCGEKLAESPAALELVRELLAETKRRQLADAPTAVMLRAGRAHPCAARLLRRRKAPFRALRQSGNTASQKAGSQKSRLRRREGRPTGEA